MFVVMLKSNELKLVNFISLRYDGDVYGFKIESII